MNIKAQLRHAIRAFNCEEWDEAKDIFTDMEGETSAAGAENLIEALGLITSAFSRVHGDDFPDQTAYERARFEMERAIELLDEGLPDSVFGIRIHSLKDKLDRFMDSVQMSAQPDTFKIELPQDEYSQHDSKAGE